MRRQLNRRHYSIEAERRSHSCCKKNEARNRLLRKREPRHRKSAARTNRRALAQDRTRPGERKPNKTGSALLAARAGKETQRKCEPACWREIWPGQKPRPGPAAATREQGTPSGNQTRVKNLDGSPDARQRTKTGRQKPQKIETR
jgi:hypothetical protein